MKVYTLKVYYADRLVSEYENDLNSVLDRIATLLDSAVNLVDIVNTKAFTFSITEVFK